MSESESTIETPYIEALPDGLVESSIVGIVFADVTGFSEMGSDLEVIRFIREFLARVAAVADALPEPALVRNTWGDGLYFVFGKVQLAGLFALGLSEMVRTTPWADLDLPPLGIRTAVHVGPLFSFIDPVTRQLTWSGRHVTRAARMEPVTPPGVVYASREFAAISAALGVQGFKCEPVGRVRLAKKEGVVPLYVVQRVVGAA